MRYILLFTVLTLVFVGVQAQEFDKAKLDKYFQLLAENDKAMGSLSIYKDGKEVYSNAIGMADVAKGIKASNETIYRIGSISKTFTTVLILQQIEEGKLSLDTKLSNFYPIVPNAGFIKIKHLLGHRSGLYNMTNAEDYSSWMEEPQSKEAMLNRIVENGVDFQPDERTEYSNTNFVLLSWIAEMVDDKDFKSILEDRITKKIGLNSTYYGGKINSSNKEAYSYSKTGEWRLATETDMSIPWGAGALVSTASDINSFFNALFTGKLVSNSSLESMKKIQEGIGLGLFAIPFHDRQAYGHNGGIDGFQSSAGYFPEDNVAVTYLSNGVATPINNILIATLSIYFGRDFELPSFKKTINLKSEDLDSFLGNYGSPDVPLKIMITKDGNTLIGQATGQPSFPLDATGPVNFVFEPAQIELEFAPEENKMILRQGGGEYVFTKE